MKMVKKIVEMHRPKKRIIFRFVNIKWLTLVLKHLLRTTFVQQNN